MMVAAETTLCVAIAAGERHVAENRMISFSSSVPSISLCIFDSTTPLLPARSVQQAIKDDFASIPEVTDVRVDVDDNNYLVSVELSDPSPARELREKIFNKEFALLRAFPDLEFDFDLV